MVRRLLLGHERKEHMPADEVLPVRVLDPIGRLDLEGSGGPSGGLVTRGATVDGMH